MRTRGPGPGPRPKGVRKPAALHQGADGGDSTAVVISIAAIVVMAWLYLFAVSDAMDAMHPPRPTHFMWLMPMGRWDAHAFVLGAAMWVVMMIGMMLPSATPMILLYALMRRREVARERKLPATALFVAGYLAVWSGFSLVAAIIQAAFTHSGLMSDDMLLASLRLAGAVLIGAGLYQFAPIKNACLAQCRAPLQFLSRHWRDGRAGVFRLGVVHGAYCLGCCWLMMLVLFAVGVMNLLWVAALSVLVLLEKLTPWGIAIARVTGAVFIVLGVAVLIRAL